MEEKKINPANATRWNSQYVKEKKLIGNKRPLALSLGETKYASRIRSTEEFVAVMEQFFQATDKMSGEKYPTISCAIPVIYSLQEKVRKTLEQTQSQSVRCLTGALLSSLKKLQKSGCTVFGKLSSMIMQKKWSSQVQQLSRQQVTLLSGAQLMKLLSEKELAPLQLKTT